MPKQTAVEMVQFQSRYADGLLLVESSTRSFDVPYGDYFVTEDTWVVAPPTTPLPFLPADARLPPAAALATARAAAAAAGYEPGTGVTRLVALMHVNFSKYTMFKNTIIARTQEGTGVFYTATVARMQAAAAKVRPAPRLPPPGGAGGAGGDGDGGEEAGTVVTPAAAAALSQRALLRAYTALHASAAAVAAEHAATVAALQAASAAAAAAASPAAAAGKGDWGAGIVAAATSAAWLLLLVLLWLLRSSAPPAAHAPVAGSASGNAGAIDMDALAAAVAARLAAHNTP